ncbi:hypothetical protein ACTG9Q_15655 [Actinokineospora sp. 24-640]
MAETEGYIGRHRKSEPYEDNSPATGKPVTMDPSDDRAHPAPDPESPR